MRQEIHVTKEMIKLGTSGSCSWCPVALAIMIGLKKKDVLVGTDNITIEGSTYSVPRTVKSFIRAFDEDKKVKPFSFVLKLRDE